MKNTSFFIADIFLFVPPVRGEIHLIFFHIEECLDVFVVLEKFIVFGIITFFKFFCGLKNHYDVMADNE